MKLKWMPLAAALLLLTACGKDAVEPPQEPEPPAAVQPDEPAGEPQPFAIDEAADVLRMTQDDAGTAFGELLADIADAEDDTIRTLEYQDASIQFADGDVARAELRSGAVPLLRGIQIGDTVDAVLSHFPNGGGEIFYPEEGSRSGYRVLYGEYVHMATYGVLEYLGDVPSQLVLSDSDVAVTIRFADGKADAVIYQIAAG